MTHEGFNPIRADAIGDGVADLTQTGFRAEMLRLRRQERTVQILRKVGAFKQGHFELSSRKHSGGYVDKSMLTPHTGDTREVCRMMAEDFRYLDIDAVVAPVIGAVMLSGYVAEELGPNVLALFAEKKLGNGEGEKTFELRGDYPKLVKEKRILLVEDVLTTGKSVINTKNAVEAAEGIVVGTVAIVNRGGITAETLGVQFLTTLANLDIPSWEQANCELCKSGVDIDNLVGHGAKKPV